MALIDLHIHTTASDGTLTPRQVVEYAYQAGMQTVGITDHYCMNGVKEAIAVGDRLGITVIPGIEINSFDQSTDLHILGYFQRDDLDFLVRHFAQLFARQIAIIKRRSYGTRFVDDRVTPQMAVELISSLGGVPVVAHPGRYGDQQLILKLLKQGVGIEAYYYTHTEEQTQQFCQLAKEYRVIITGGSDCHGPEVNDGELIKIGEVPIPSDLKFMAKEGVKYVGIQ